METSVDKKNPLFSVIVPTYNRAKLIESTIRSVKTQEFCEYEIIVVDDGSIDETTELVKEFPEVSLYEHPNSGPGAARNLGLKHARGQYIAFLDSDDLWFPWTLDTYARVIKEFDNPSFIAGKPFSFENEESLQHIYHDDLEVKSFRDYLESADEWRWFGVSSFVIRKDVILEAGGFAEGRINAEDAELALRLGTAPGFIQITSPLTFGYRVHGGNVTLNSEKTQKGLNLILDQTAGSVFSGGSRRSSERWRIISRHIRPHAIQCARQGELGSAFHFYWKTLSWHLKSFRWKFLLSLPLIAAFSSFKKIFESTEFDMNSSNATD